MRTLDVGFLNDVANDPAVRPHIGGEGPIDLAGLATNVDNYLFLAPGCGGFVVQNIYDTRYECHSMFLPHSAPDTIRTLMQDSQQYMFACTNCEELVTKVPEGNVSALGLARVGGFAEIYRSGPVSEVGGKTVSHRSLTLDKWARLCSAAREAGQQFHEMLDGAKRLNGSTASSHPEDELHDRIVGAAMLMVRAGNLVKGIRFYNRFASFAGYRQAEIVSTQPAVVDIGDAVLDVHNGEVGVLQCR